MKYLLVLFIFFYVLAQDTLIEFNYNRAYGISPDLLGMKSRGMLPELTYFAFLRDISTVGFHGFICLISSCTLKNNSPFPLHHSTKCVINRCISEIKQ